VVVEEDGLRTVFLERLDDRFGRKEDMVRSGGWVSRGNFEAGEGVARGGRGNDDRSPRNICTAEIPLPDDLKTSELMNSVKIRD